MTPRRHRYGWIFVCVSIFVAVGCTQEPLGDGSLGEQTDRRQQALTTPVQLSCQQQTNMKNPVLINSGLVHQFVDPLGRPTYIGKSAGKRYATVYDTSTGTASQSSGLGTLGDAGTFYVCRENPTTDLLWHAKGSGSNRTINRCTFDKSMRDWSCSHFTTGHESLLSPSLDAFGCTPKGGYAYVEDTNMLVVDDPNIIPNPSTQTGYRAIIFNKRFPLNNTTAAFHGPSDSLYAVPRSVNQNPSGAGVVFAFRAGTQTWTRVAGPAPSLVYSQMRAEFMTSGKQLHAVFGGHLLTDTSKSETRGDDFVGSFTVDQTGRVNYRTLPKLPNTRAFSSPMIMGDSPLILGLGGGATWTRNMQTGMTSHTLRGDLQTWNSGGSGWQKAAGLTGYRLGDPVEWDPVNEEAWVIDPRTQGHTPTICQSSGCPQGQACNDNNVCTQMDRCNAQGMCTGTPAPKGTPCNDENPRTTQDQCDGQGACVGKGGTVPTDGGMLDTGMRKDTGMSDAGDTGDGGRADGGKVDGGCPNCMCTGSPGSAMESLSFGFESPEWECPVGVDGSAQVTGKLNTSKAVETPHCTNNCVGETSAKADIEMGVTLCGDEYTTNANGSFTRKLQMRKTCHQASCQETCTGPRCDTKTYKAEAGITQTKDWGVEKEWEKWDLLDLSVECKASLSAGVNLGGSYETVGGDAAGCRDCQTTGASVGSEATANIGCIAGIGVSGYGLQFGCSDCGSAKADFDIGYERQRGSCGDRDCWSSDVTFNLDANTPCFPGTSYKGKAVGWILWAARGQTSYRCSAGLEAAINSNTCGGNKSSVDASLSCRGFPETYDCSG